MTADQYRAKWVRQTKQALAAAIKAGGVTDEAIERIHRRYHRAMPLEDMRIGVGYAEAMERARRLRLKCDHPGHEVPHG